MYCSFDKRYYLSWSYCIYSFYVNIPEIIYANNCVDKITRNVSKNECPRTLLFVKKGNLQYLCFMSIIMNRMTCFLTASTQKVEVILMNETALISILWVMKSPRWTCIPSSLCKDRCSAICCQTCPECMQGQPRPVTGILLSVVSQHMAPSLFDLNIPIVRNFSFRTTAHSSFMRF